MVVNTAPCTSRPASSAQGAPGAFARRRSTPSLARALSSSAALRVKVTAAMRRRGTPLSSRAKSSSTKVWVLPVPAEAT